MQNQRLLRRVTAVGLLAIALVLGFFSVANAGFAWLRPATGVNAARVAAEPTEPRALATQAPTAEPSPTAVAQVTPAPTTTPTVAPTLTVVPTPTAAPAADLTTIKPNELGRIMILEYHQFGPTEDRWTRSYDNFRKDLERLYRTGYRPIGVNDYINNHIDVPAGTTPIIFTFDDSSPGQFRYIPGPDGQPVVDPDSALGIWLDFHKQHPDWGLRGTFYVLAGVEPIHRLFGQPEYAQQKLQELVKMGFELGNHTFWHMELSKLDKAGVNEQLGKAVKAITDLVPGYKVDSLALPLGAHAKDINWAVDGSFEGTSYHNDAILEVSGGGAYSPNNKKADLLHLPRIQATHMEWDFYTAFFDYYDAHPDERYVSDGNPDRIVFPKALAADYRAGAKDKSLGEVAPGYLGYALR